MHANSPGVVVPPPPEKQAMGRFESNFVESRRAALEKMLNKTAAHPTLQHDSDLKLFLESESFNVDVKHKERKEPNLGESKGIMSSLGISVGTSVKFVEQDDVSGAFFMYAFCYGFLLLTNRLVTSGSMSARFTWTR